MCISSFIQPSCRGGGGGGDMALKHYPPPPPLPFQWLSGKSKKKNKNNNKMKIHDVHDGSKESSSSCESPRSVLESSEGLERNKNSNRVGLAIVVAFEVEEEAIATPHTLHYKAPTTPPISLQHCHKATLLALQEDDVEEEEYDDDDDDDDEDEEETERESERARERSGRIVPSIFSVGSPLLASTLEDDEEEFPWPLMEEALTACFLCKRSFEGGKDIYIYRGDRAFCSEECRYQQVMVDESWHSDCSPLLY